MEIFHDRTAARKLTRKLSTEEGERRRKKLTVCEPARKSETVLCIAVLRSQQLQSMLTNGNWLRFIC